MTEILLRTVVLGQTAHRVPVLSTTTLCGLAVKSTRSRTASATCLNCAQTEPGYLEAVAAQSAGWRQHRG